MSEQQPAAAPPAEVKVPTVAAGQEEKTEGSLAETCKPAPPLASSSDVADDDDDGVADDDADDAGTTTRAALLSDEELLERHYPRYFYDKRETHFPIDLNK